MSDARVKIQQQNVSRASDGDWTNLRALRDGALIAVPWYQALVLEGRCFSAAAPGEYDITGVTVMGTYADGSKTLAVDIPDATAAFPLLIETNFNLNAATVSHMSAMVTTALNGTGGTETEVSELNLRVDNPVSSGATAMHTVSSATDNVDATERVLFHWSSAQDLDTIDLDPYIRWSVAKCGIAPIVIDAGSIVTVMFNATGTGFSLIHWAEIAESAFN
jgi:hypothetical protein